MKTFSYVLIIALILFSFFTCSNNEQKPMKPAVEDIKTRNKDIKAIEPKIIVKETQLIEAIKKKEEEVKKEDIDLDDKNEIGEPELIDMEGMKITKLVLARGIDKGEKGRTPREPGKSFLNDGNRVYAFIEVDNPTKDPSELKVSWVFPNSDKERGQVELEVGTSKKWRTWAFTSFCKKSGMYEVVVRDQEDQLLARAPFEIVDTI